MDLDAGAVTPLELLRGWITEAGAAGNREPTAMCLATVDAEGMPDARIVLCRGIADDALIWFTNRRSAKGQQLAVTPAAAAVFHWPELERQLRVRGSVEPLDDDASDTYFAGRPRGSQLAAWASAQSEPIADRAALEAKVAEVTARFDGGPVPRPPHWGGYRLVVASAECWMSRPSRLHDRLRYVRDGDAWSVKRLQP